ncbi:MAG: hydrogenase maturation protein [Methylococcaceae bacterium]|nr:hydrogenase maturation protein [Methylococcaceae bacterium]
MRILLIASAYNGLCQRAHVELEALGYEVSVTLALSSDFIRKGIAFFQPDLIICPFLKEKLPKDIWTQKLCLIVHPGIKGDRGPSSLDWAIINGETEWGVTVLQAAEEMDAGDIWATETFPMRKAGKASIYRKEVTNAAVRAMLQTVRRFEKKDYVPEPLDYTNPDVRGELRPLMKQVQRQIDWANDDVETIIKKINAADSFPGVLDVINHQEFYVYGVHKENRIQGWQCLFQNWQPGDIVGQRHGAILRAAVDGLVWISHLKRKNIEYTPFYKRMTSTEKQHGIKLPAATVLGSYLDGVPELPIDPLDSSAGKTFREIRYEENNAVGYLHFDFHNGAMSTEQCRRLLEAYRLALARPTKVLVLMGGREFWSNGIHLNVIEAAQNPARESWENINAIDDFVLAVLTTDSKLTVSAVWGGCGAGGAMAILAADQVWAREGVVFNPHYKLMGLYGSEYWTYSLPKRVGPLKALELTERALPIGTRKAKTLGYIDAILPNDYVNYLEEVRYKAEALATASQYPKMLEEKAFIRQRDERLKPLADYRAAELLKMKTNFFGKCAPGQVNYHHARYNFVHKIKPAETSPCMVNNSFQDVSRLNELRLSLAS